MKFSPNPFEPLKHGDTPVAWPAAGEDRRRGEGALRVNVSVDNLIGQTIGGCVIEALTGRGGMARVYRARQKHLDRVVALKVLDPALATDQGYVNRFLREMRILARLSHPNIVTVYDGGQEKGHLYIVMEHIDGQTLSQMLQQRGPLPVDRARDVVLSICGALGYAHKQGLVHRDVKPANVMIDKHTGAVKVMDFGIALDQSGVRETVLGAVMGTYEYMAPEQVEGRGDIDARADIYALGLMFYELLTGTTPYKELPNSRVIYEKMSRTAPLTACAKARRAPRPQVETLDHYDRVIRSMIQREPAKRPTSCAEIGAAITVGDRAGPEIRVRPPRRDSRLKVLLAAMVVLLVGLVGFQGAMWWLRTRKRDKPNTGPAGALSTVQLASVTVGPKGITATWNNDQLWPASFGYAVTADGTGGREIRNGGPEMHLAMPASAKVTTTVKLRQDQTGTKRVVFEVDPAGTGSSPALTIDNNKSVGDGDEWSKPTSKLYLRPAGVGSEWSVLICNKPLVDNDAEWLDQIAGRGSVSKSEKDKLDRLRQSGGEGVRTRADDLYRRFSRLATKCSKTGLIANAKCPNRGGSYYFAQGAGLCSCPPKESPKVYCSVSGRRFVSGTCDEGSNPGSPVDADWVRKHLGKEPSDSSCRGDYHL
jgi:hypothetical protein